MYKTCSDWEISNNKNNSREKKNQTFSTLVFQNENVIIACHDQYAKVNPKALYRPLFSFHRSNAR